MPRLPLATDQKLQECEDVREIYGLMKEFSEHVAPGAYLADLMPPLAQIPVNLQWWRRRALKCYHRQANIWLKYWGTLRQQIAEKTAPECFVKQYIETDYRKQGIDEEQSAFVAGSEHSRRQWDRQMLTGVQNSDDRGRFRDDFILTKQRH